MDCPQCGTPTSVTDSRLTNNGTVHRRRECQKRHRFSTTEILKSEFDALKQKEDLLAQHSEVLKKCLTN